jgi:two-component system OmpR family response regulator
MATHAIQPEDHAPPRQHTLLLATTDPDQRTFLAAQLDADGHTVYEADTTTRAVTALCGQAIDVLVLGELQRPADAPGLLRGVRGGEHPRIHPGLPVITLGAGDELTTLRAYESGSDHHLPHDTGYVLLRAVLHSVIRRAFEDLTARHLQVGEIGVDLAARSASVAGRVVHLSRLEFELLVKFASDPVRVFNRDDLARCFWRGQISGRTVDSHVARLRTRLTSAGADEVLVNTWGQGWSLTRPR